MAWTYWPIVNDPIRPSGILPGSGTDIQYYNWLTQIWRGVWERLWCLDGRASQTIVGSGGFTWTTPEVVPLPSRTNIVWAGGTISSIVQSGVSDWVITDLTLAPAPSGQADDGHWWNGQERHSGCSHQYWVGLDCTDDPPDLPYLPSNYDIIIEYDNGTDEWYRDIQPWQIIRGDITATTSQTVRFTCNLDNYVTAGVIPDTNLVGKRFYIIKTGGLWWADKDFEFGRYPEWPNTNELWKGTVDAGKIFVGGSGYLFEELNDIKEDPYNIPWNYRNNWQDRDWVGGNKQILVFDGSGILHRIGNITSNTDQTIFFGGLDFIPPASGEPQVTANLTGDYIIIGPSGSITDTEPLVSGIPASGMGWPGRDSMPITWWYGGAHKDIYYHDPSDSIPVATKSFADDSVTWEELETTFDVACGDPESQHTENDPVDRDVWSSVTNMCDPADFCFSPHLNKTLRSMQVAIEGLIPSFVRPVSYNGAKEIVSYSPAQCFADCGINAGSGTIITPAPGGDYTFTVPSGFNNASLYYETVRDGLRTAVGTTSANASGIAVVTSASSGSTVVYSAGWTRYRPREFTHMYERAAFIPTVITEEDVDTVVFPPSTERFEELGCTVGMWVSRTVSSGYRSYDTYGYVQDASNGLTTGDVARYVGDNWEDPGTGVTYDSEEYSPDIDYWDRLYEGNHPRQTEILFLSQRKGTVSSGTKYSLTDEGKNWWNYWYANGGEMHQESGSGIAGSSTSITLERKFMVASGVEHCWWQPSRFIGPQFDSIPYRNFIIEIDKPVTSGVVTYKMPITNVTNVDDGDEAVIHFDAPDGTFSVQAGWNWRIREPKTNLNRYRGKRVIITSPSGNRVELDITHNDHNTLFFTPQSQNIEVGSKYQIIEYHTGGTWEFQSTEPTAQQKAGGPWQKIGPNGYWVQPSGTDARGMPWHTDNTENLPHKYYKEFGRIHKGDYIYYDTFNEMYMMLNRLVWTQTTVSWTSRADDDVPELNSKTGNTGLQPGLGYNEEQYDYMVGLGDAAWDAATPVEQNSLPPTAISIIDLSDGGVNPVAITQRRYAYAKVTNVPDLIAHVTSVWSVADEVETETIYTCDNGGAESQFYYGTFDDNGDGVGFNVYGQLSTTSTPNKLIEERVLVGSTSFEPQPAWGDFVPNPCPEPLNQVFEAIFTRGYSISVTKAILKWNVEGGLRYVDWQA